MKKILMMAAVMMGFANSILAQSLKITGTLEGKVPADLKLYVMPVGEAWVKPDSITLEGQKLQAETKLSPYQIYKLVGVASQRQMIIPFHLEAKEGTAKLTLSLTDEGLLDFVQPDADTKSLVAFSNLTVDRNKQMWMSGKKMEAGRLKGLLTGYSVSADSIISVYHPSVGTSQYLRLWASTTTFESIESVKFATGRTPQSIDIDPKGVNARLVGAVDCKMATAFDSAPRLVLSTVPEGSLAERIAYIEQQVKDAGLRGRAEDVLLNQYITTFNYSANYENGLKELTDLTQRFGLDEKYLGEFKMRKASIAGTPFPKNVNLYDLKGNKVDFSKYHGKYVYVDMWASWCIPCIKEIPHLKALEKELQNKDVMFLSVSIDTKEEAWKKKVAALGLEGELLINKDNKLGESLNVSGIPFFLIYDKEGKLYMYNAYRPSDVRLKPLLEGLK